MSRHIIFYANSYDPFAQRAFIVLNEKKQSVERRDLQDLPERHKLFNLSGTQLPVLVVDDIPIQLMMLICEYLDETMGPTTLHPKDPMQRAIHNYHCEIGTWMLVTMAQLHRSADKDQLNSKAETIRTMLGVLENKLDGSPYFSGDTFSFVDIWFGTIAPYFDVYEQHTDLDFLGRRPRLRTYFANLTARESVAKAIPLDAKEHMLQAMKDRNSEFSRILGAR